MSVSLPGSVYRKVFGIDSVLSEQLFTLPSNSRSIFFISFSLLSYEGSVVFQAFAYPWRMPRGTPCHGKVLNFSVALMPFLSGSVVLRGNGLQRYANSEITDLGPCLKFLKCLQGPMVSSCKDHTLSALFFHYKGCCKTVLFMCFFIYLI